MRIRYDSSFKTGSYSNNLVLNIVHDGLEASQGSNLGKLVPVVVVDLTDRSDVKDVLRAHQEAKVGDCSARWGHSLTDREEVFLVLDFIRPVAATAVLRFPLRKWAGFVDAIVRSELLLVQEGKPGVKTIHTGNPRIGLQVGSDTFKDAWESIYQTVTITQLREAGMKRKEARRRALQVIEQHRQLSAFQFPT